MKKAISIFVSIVILLCAFTSAMPSFALNYGSFSYEIVDEEIIITKYIGSNRTSITVPATINNIPVVAIAEGAFKGNTELTSVTVKSGVKDIGASAFENCTNLATISLPETVIHIGEKAIYNTAYYNDKSNWKLKKNLNGSSSDGVNIGGSSSADDSISWEEIIAPVLQYLYLDKNLIEIELVGKHSVKSGTLVIADGAFKGNAEVIEVGLPSSIVAIGCNAFEGCTDLESVRNLNLVDYIGDGAFKDCTSLEVFDISESAVFNANAIYNSGYYNNPENWENGALYMGNRIVGIDFEKRETIVRDGTTHIVGEALADKNAIIPASVTSIADNAFTSTENVTIFGYSDTYAQTYAVENDIPFIDLDTLTKGDVNCDGNVNSEDYEILCSVAATREYQSYVISIAGDMDDDGAVDGIDVIILDLMLNDMPPSRLKGDVNGDGKVDADDYALLVKIVSTKARVTDNVMFQRADINEDGAVDSFDAIYLDLALNGLVALI